MNTSLLKLTIMVMAGSLLYSIPGPAQVSPTTDRAGSVKITKGPETERVDPDFAIITWTSNNPGGTPEHFGVVHYGTSPRDLGQIAKSPIRLNPSHSYTVFRVRMDDLKPGTTYYYTVDSMEPNGKSDGVKSEVKQFKTEAEKDDVSKKGVTTSQMAH
jgi:phosphodiesterase/alkaline phosphatase D-like protein